MTMASTTREQLEKTIEKKENNLRKLLKKIQQYETKIPLSMRKNLKGFKRVQQLKENMLQPKTRAELNINKQFHSKCFQHLLKTIKDIYLEKHKSEENIKEFLANEDHKKEILKQLKENYQQIIDKSRYKKNQKAKSCSALNLKPKASVIYQKRIIPKLLPSAKNKFPSNNVEESTSTTDTLEMNYPVLKYNFFNKKSNRCKESVIELAAKPKQTLITSGPLVVCNSLDKYRVKPKRLQPSISVQNSLKPITIPRVDGENNQISTPVEENTSSKSNMQHYYKLFDNIFYNQIRSSVENSLTYLQQRRENLTENMHDAVMLGHSKNSAYGKQVNIALKNLVQLVDN